MESTPDLSVFEDELEELEALDPEDPESASEFWLVCREVEEEIKEASEAPYRKLKEQIKEAEKATLPVRKRAKGLVDSATEKLDALYHLAQSTLDIEAKRLLEAGDHEAFSALPDTPPLAEDVTFAEIQELFFTDITKIPREFLVPDVKAIKAALKTGEDVPGALLAPVKSWRKKARKKSD